MRTPSSSYRLVAVAGKMKGRSWTLQRGGLVFGRSAGCDVSILDPAISRRQYRLFFEDGQVCLEDLGSRNPALVNGAPLTKTTLKAGDEITLGIHRFVLAADAGEHGQGQTEEAHAFDTKSWAEGEPVSLDVESVRKGMPPGPQTISDLFFLYDSAREMSGTESIDGLAPILMRRLQERFAPRRMWLALVHDEKELTFLRHSSVERDEENAVPRDLIHQALEQRPDPATGACEGQAKFDIAEEGEDLAFPFRRPGDGRGGCGCHHG